MSLTAALPEEIKRRAKKELHEDEKQIEAHLESFRRWVLAVPHIKFPTDSHLLLPFLRQAKYIHSKAQARLDNFCTLRASPQAGAPDWFQYPSLDDPVVDIYLKAGIFTELGRSDDDITVMLVRFGAWDLDKLSRLDLRRMRHMDVDRILSDPIAQVVGCAILFDLTGVTAGHLFKDNDRREMKIEAKIWQESYPLRMKYLIFYNEPTIMDAMFKLMEPWWSKKMRERVVRVRSHLYKACEKIRGLEKILPKDYGGDNKSIKELTAEKEKRFREFYSKPSVWREIQLDESLRPDSAKNYMREYKDAQTDLFGTEGTYVQLNE